MVAAGLALTGMAALEIRTSWLQSRLLSAAGRRIAYAIGPGPSPAIRYPASGPENTRLGYTRQAEFVRRLLEGGYQVTHQARWSPLAMSVVDAGLFPAYVHKGQAGLVVLDRAGQPLYEARHPRRAYARFEDIPALVVDSLLFIENRELLQPFGPRQNPAIEYPRLMRAVLDVTRRAVNPAHPVSGGSTLATQLEKLRHSPDGRTGSIAEKARQMASASLRAYLGGEQTDEARRLIVRDYVNALPLGAIAGYGEVTGLADGLWAWYGVDMDTFHRDLATDAEKTGPAAPARAAAYRQALTLVLAARRPTTYLVRDPAALEARVDAYLGALASAGVIAPGLRDAALGVRPATRARVAMPPLSYAERKAVDAVRLELVSRLGLAGTYDLDRLDLTVRSTVDGPVNAEVTRVLNSLGDPAAARKAGLAGHRLLSGDRPEPVIYSFMLYERGSAGNLLRVQADNFDHPLNINEGTRLELGSTAKLRTLVTYLEVAERLHAQYAPLPVGTLRALSAHPSDSLRGWAIAHLSSTGDRSLAAMLEAALERRYSASPAEAFFTGGGLHRFGNFDGRDNARVMSVREAFRNSVNLVFIRLMRDLVRFHVYERPEWAGVLHEADHPLRPAYLVRFADREGQVYLQRFFHKYQGDSPDEALRRLGRGALGRDLSLAVMLRSVRPATGLDDLAAFLDAHGGRPGDATLQRLFEQSAPEQWTWQDLGYLARVHPLELWYVRHVQQRPEATLDEVIGASTTVRQEAYAWLFKTRSVRARQRAVTLLVEEDAFGAIHQAWQRHGYPFASMVPSYATALGSSGDNPAALSDLLGIILNDGVRLPTTRVARARFGEGTPYETHLARRSPDGERVLPAAVAAALKRELVGVVDHGSGRRVAGGVTLGDGNVLPIGGKTGTGDNRVEAAGGRRSRVVNRTATFAFTIGDRFFGTVVAFVPGPEAAAYDFTSALPVQLLKHLLPSLEPLLEEPAPRRVH